MRLNTKVLSIEASGEGNLIDLGNAKIWCRSVVIVTGGLSIPKIGATRFGYDIARQFGLKVTSVKSALVPLTFQAAFLERCRELSGLSVDAEVSYRKTTFREGLLFTHRGLSGPSILQISSYWDEGETLKINLLPDMDASGWLRACKTETPRQEVLTVLSENLPRRLAANILEEMDVSGRLADKPNKMLSRLGEWLN